MLTHNLTPSTSPNTTTGTSTSTSTSRLLTSLHNIQRYTPKLTTALLHPGAFEDDPTPNIPYLLLEGTRLANQLIEDLIAFDVSGGRTASGVPRFPAFRAGVDGRAFVELYEAFNRECIDRGGCDKEEMVRERAFWGFWRALERSCRGLMGYLV